MIKSIINYIDEKKKEEFRYKLDVYYTPKDFYTNPEYQNYYHLYPKSDYIDTSLYTRIVNNIAAIILKCIGSEAVNSKYSTMHLSQNTITLLNTELNKNNAKDK